MSRSFKNHVKKYLEFWVTTEAGREYWQNWFYHIALNPSHDSGQNDIARHILLADSVPHEIDPTVKSQFLNKLGFLDKNECPEATVIVIVGPVGVGKSSYGRLLHDKTKAQGIDTVIIDGDSPPPYSSEMTLALGKERGPATLWALIRTIYEGRIPILSAGGGVLFGNTDFILDDRLESLLRQRLNLILYLPCEIDMIDVFYQNWITDDIIKYRLTTKIWSTKTRLTNFLSQIQLLSKSNSKFAELLVKKASTVYTYEPLTESFNMPKDIVMPESLVTLRCHPRLYVSQIRLIAHVKGHNFSHYGHITLFYTDAQRLEIIEETYLSLQKFKEPGFGAGSGSEGFPGLLVSDKGMCFVSIPDTKLANAISELGFPVKPEELHITITAGKHLPFMMRSACLQFNDPSLRDIVLAISGPNRGWSSEKLVYHKDKLQTSPCTIEILDCCFI